MKWLAGWEGVFWSGGTFFAALAVGLLADWRWEWSRTTRGFWLVHCVVATGICVWFTWLRRWRAVPESEALALWLEGRRPELRSRLISALQLANHSWTEPDSAAFVARLQDSAVDGTAGMEPGTVIPADGVRRAASRVVPVLLGILVFFVMGGTTSLILLRRAFLEEVSIPRRTRLVEVSGAFVVGRGEDVALRVRAEGVLPRAGWVIVRQDSGREQRFSLDAEEVGEGVYGRVLPNVLGSFRYRVRVNDAESGEYAVEVLPRPVLTNLVVRQVLPEYTGQGTRVMHPGEISLLRGSRVELEGRASQPLKEATVRLSGSETSRLARVVSEPSPGISANLSVTDPRWNAFSVELVDERGIRSRDSAVYAVEVVADQVPQVRMILPTRREELVTARGTVLLSFEVKDDFGIGALRVRHQPAGGTNREPATIALEAGGLPERVSRRRFEWRLATIVPPLTEGTLHEFWVEATDRNDVDGPGTGRSDRFLLRVVSEAEKRADLLGRAGDAIGRLGDVAVGQERLNESLGRIILARPSGP